MRAKLLVQADVFEVFLDVGRRERRVHGARARRHLFVHHLHVLFETPLGELGRLNVSVGVVIAADELNLVLVLLLHLLATAGELFDRHLERHLVTLFVLADVNLDGLLAPLLFLLGGDTMVSLTKASLSSPCWYRQRMYSFGVFSRCCSM